MSEEIIKIAVLEQKLLEFANIVGKIDNAIEKMSEVNTNITKMLAVHDERIEQCNRSDALLIKMIDDLKVDNSKDHGEVVSRIDEIEKKVDDLSKFRWMVGGIGILAVIVTTTFATFASNWIKPMENYHQHKQEFIKK